mmetsp:Transcript_53955/g.151640  ORF Transcript_53955/g.151640 Transcript_53955/m.151640 type:complete len:213 (+) Transcript_53955:80-718(+)
MLTCQTQRRASRMHRQATSQRDEGPKPSYKNGNQSPKHPHASSTAYMRRPVSPSDRREDGHLDASPVLQDSEAVPALHLPEARCVIVRGGQCQRAVRGEGDRVDGLAVPRQCPQTLARGRAPQLRGAVRGGREYQRAVGREFHSANILLMAGEGVRACPRLRIPELRVAARGRHDERPIVRHRGPLDRMALVLEGADALPGCHGPQPGGVVN